MPSKEDPTKNRTGGAKQSGNGQEPTDESGRSTRSTAKSAEAQRTALATSDGGQVQPAVAEFSAKTMAEDVGKTSHGAPPANEARARTSTEGSQDAEMEDTTVKDKNDSARIAELESLLRSEKDANINLQRTIAEYESGSTGQRKSLVERAQEIGFVRDASGKLSLGSPASRGFDYSKPYTYINR